MTPEQALKIIWKHRGLCWHKHRYIGDGGPIHFRCTKCFKVNEPNPDSNDWLTFGDVWTWAKGEEWWGEFIKVVGSDTVEKDAVDLRNGTPIKVQIYGRDAIYVDLVGPALFPELAEFLEGRK